MIILTALLLAIVLIALFHLRFQRLGAAGLNAQMRLDRSRLKPGEQLTLTFSLDNRKFRILPLVVFQLSYPSLLQLTEPAHPRESGSVQTLTLRTSLLPWTKKTRQLHFTALQRGVGEFRMQSELSDWLGIISVDGPAWPSLAVAVHPQPLVLSAVNPQNRSDQGQQRVRRWILEDPIFFTGVRPYAPGDSLRRIDWKASARLNALHVRQFDPTADPSWVIILLVNPHKALFIDDAHFIDQAASFAATLIRQCLRRQQPAALITNSVIKLRVADTSFCDSSQNHLISCLDLLACVTPYPLQPPLTLFSRAASQLNYRHHCVLFSSEVSTSLQQNLYALSQRGVAVTLVTRDDQAVCLPHCEVLTLKAGERE